VSHKNWQARNDSCNIRYCLRAGNFIIYNSQRKNGKYFYLQFHYTYIIPGEMQDEIQQRIISFISSSLIPSLYLSFIPFIPLPCSVISPLKQWIMLHFHSSDGIGSQLSHIWCHKLSPVHYNNNFSHVTLLNKLSVKQEL
jgi:hypothetical protein